MSRLCILLLVVMVAVVTTIHSVKAESATTTNEVSVAKRSISEQEVSVAKRSISKDAESEFLIRVKRGRRRRGRRGRRPRRVARRGRRHRGRRHKGIRHRGGRHKGIRHRGGRHKGIRHKRRRHKGIRHKGRRHKGRRHKGRRHKGRRHKGRRHRGRRHRGRRHRGRRHRGRRHRGRRHRGRRHRGRRHRGGRRRGWGAVKRGAGAAVGGAVAVGVIGAYLGFESRRGVDCTGSDYGTAAKLHQGVCAFKCMVDMKCTGFVYGGGTCQSKNGVCKRTNKAGYGYYRMPPRSGTLLNSFVMIDGQCQARNIKAFRAKGVIHCLKSCQTNEDCLAVTLNIKNYQCELKRKACKKIRASAGLKTFINVNADTYVHYRGKCKAGLGAAAKKSFAHCQRLCTTTKSCNGFVYRFDSGQCHTMNKRCEKDSIEPAKLHFTYNKMSREELTKKCSAGEVFSWVRYTGVSLLMKKLHRKMVRVNNIQECDRQCKQSAGFVCTSYAYDKNVCTMFKLPPEKGDFSCVDSSTVVEKTCRVTGLRTARRRSRRRGRRRRGRGSSKPSTSGMCKCSWSGDPHYRTFDGYMIHFMGRCKYTTVETMVPDDHCKIHVRVKNTDKGRASSRVTWTKYTEIVFAGDVIRFYSPTRKIQVNGSPPSKFAGKCHSTKKGFYRLLKTGGGFLFEAPQCQITVQMSPWTATVTVPSKYRGDRKIRGICGDCNGKRDDLRMKDGASAGSGRPAYKKIGDSYLVHDKEALLHQCIVKEDFGCSKKMDRLVHTDQYCGFITKKNGPFKACIASGKVNHKEFEESCKIDVCSYKDDTDAISSAVCHNIKQFAAQCASKSFPAKWRTDKFCPIKCPKNQVYKSGVTACPATCSNRRAPLECELPTRSGCICHDGFILSGDKCIRKKYCATRIVGDLTIILDGTMHITEPDFSKQKEFIVFMLEKFIIDQTALAVQFIQFGQKVEEIVPFGKYSDLPDLLRKIRRVTHEGGSTQSSEALEFAKNLIIKRAKIRPAKIAPKLLLYVTNRDPMEDDAAKEQLTLMAMKDIKIIITGMVAVELRHPTLTYGEIRHLIINTNTKPKSTTKWVVNLIENEAKCGNGMYYDGIQCKDIDECGLRICPRGSKCVNTKGSYRCYCKRGFIYNEEKGCMEINECYNRPCLKGSKCKNVPGTYECSCKKGFRYDMRHGCLDNNECQDNPGICKGGAKCTNNRGGYKCECGAGKAYVAGKGCVAKNPCDKKPCKGSSECVASSESAHTCKCPFGFQYKDTCGCVEENLCNKDPCGKDVTCKSKIGGFYCLCPKGKRWGKKAKKCVEVDLCDSPGRCKGSARCASAKGEFTCTCDKGNIYDTRAGCVLPDEVTPLIESVYIIDSSKRVSPEVFYAIKGTLRQITVGLAGKAPTINQAIILSADDAHLVMEPEERIVDQVIHEIGELKSKQTENSNFPESFDVVSKSIFKGKPSKPTYRVVTFVVVGTPSKPISSMKPLTDKLRKDGVHIQGINIGAGTPGKLSVLTGDISNLIYVYYPAMVLPAHTFAIENILSYTICPPKYARVGKYCQAVTKSTATCEIDGRLFGMNEERTKNCVVTKCTRIGPKIVRTECRRADGRCVAVGTKRFPCFINGVFTASCTCSSVKSGQVTYVKGPKFVIHPFVTLQGKKCVLPFFYRGKVHFTCVDEKGENPWCSLTINFGREKRRGECAPLYESKASCSIGGKVHQVGEMWKVGCSKYECVLNPKNKLEAYIIITQRCESADGKCVDQDASSFACKIHGVVYDSCTCSVNSMGIPEYTVSQVQVTTVEVIPGETTTMQFFCYHNNKWYKNGDLITVDCVQMQCNTQASPISFNIKKLSCQKEDGSCIPLNSKNFPCKLEGTTYKGCSCEKSESGDSVAYSYVSATGITRTYQFDFSMAVQRQATCKSTATGKSYKEGEEWTEHCSKMKCVGELGMSTMILERKCEGTDNKCYDLNTKDFPCQINGKKHAKCVCGSDSENRIVYESMDDQMKPKCLVPETGKTYDIGKNFVVGCHTLKCLGTGGTETVKAMCADTKGTCHAAGAATTYQCNLNQFVTSDHCQCVKDPTFGIMSMAYQEVESEYEIEIDSTSFELEIAAVRGEVETLKKKKK